MNKVQPKRKLQTATPVKPVIAKKLNPPKPEKKKATLANGVVIEDHKIGNGPKAKNGTKLGIRYIGKLSKNGKEFDKNTKGKPFRFTLGKGEVIKGIHQFLWKNLLIILGWDIGLEGIQLGGERKIHHSCCDGIWI